MASPPRSDAPASSGSEGSRLLARAAGKILSPLKAVAKKIGSSVHIALSELLKFSTSDLIGCLEAGKTKKGKTMSVRGFFAVHSLNNNQSQVPRGSSPSPSPTAS